LLVVGLARSGVAAALALRAKGEEVIGLDAAAGAGARSNAGAGPAAGVDALADAGVELHLHQQGVELLERVNAVIKSPGVPAQAPIIAADGS